MEVYRPVFQEPMPHHTVGRCFLWLELFAISPESGSKFYSAFPISVVALYYACINILQFLRIGPIRQIPQKLDNRRK
jgi:hypothetical protein